jgi:hypothetical protein
MSLRRIPILTVSLVIGSTNSADFDDFLPPIDAV